MAVVSMKDGNTATIRVTDNGERERGGKTAHNRRVGVSHSANQGSTEGIDLVECGDTPIP